MILQVVVGPGQLMVTVTSVVAVAAAIAGANITAWLASWIRTLHHNQCSCSQPFELFVKITDIALVAVVIAKIPTFCWGIVFIVCSC